MQMHAVHMLQVLLGNMCKCMHPPFKGCMHAYIVHPRSFLILRTEVLGRYSFFEESIHFAPVSGKATEHHSKASWGKVSYYKYSYRNHSTVWRSFYGVLNIR